MIFIFYSSKYSPRHPESSLSASYLILCSVLLFGARCRINPSPGFVTFVKVPTYWYNNLEQKVIRIHADQTDASDKISKRKSKFISIRDSITLTWQLSIANLQALARWRRHQHCVNSQSPASSRDGPLQLVDAVHSDRRGLCLSLAGFPARPAHGRHL